MPVVQTTSATAGMRKALLCFDTHFEAHSGLCVLCSSYTHYGDGSILLRVLRKHLQALFSIAVQMEEA